LKVIYRKERGGILVITAYDLSGKALKGLSSPPAKTKPMKKDPNKYPPGLDAAKIRRIIDYYDHQTDEEAAEEIENAPAAKGAIWMQVPNELVPKIRELIAKRRKSA
jgi:hypothetical protein